jgi:hypothetical protein
VTESERSRRTGRDPPRCPSGGPPCPRFSGASGQPCPSSSGEERYPAGSPPTCGPSRGSSLSPPSGGSIPPRPRCGACSSAMGHRGSGPVDLSTRLISAPCTTDVSAPGLAIGRSLRRRAVVVFADESGLALLQCAMKTCTDRANLGAALPRSVTEVLGDQRRDLGEPP